MSFLHIIVLYTTIILTSGKYKSCKDNESLYGIGTVLFTAADTHKQCWSQEEIAILSTRMILEDLLPDISVLNIDCNDFVEDVVGYFRLLIEVVKKATYGRKKRITLLALTDLLGGYLQYAVLPIARYAFYAGAIDYTSIEKLIELFEEIKWFLRTNGQGWAKPMKLTSSLIIEPINFETETPKIKSCCKQLIFYETERRSADDNNTSIVIRSNIVFPMPFFDSRVRPASIAVPFKKYPLRNIESRKASHILMKFFVGAVQCLKEKNTEKETQQKFLNSIFTWSRKEVLPKLEDDKFYSAFGGILRIIETLKTMGAVEYTNMTCLPDGEQEMALPTAGSSNKHVSSSLTLIMMLIIIISWFIIGTAFICYRMRRHRRKFDGQDPKPKPKDFSSSTTGNNSKWSLFSRSKSETKTDQESIGKCKCSTKSTPYSSSYTSDYDIEEKIKKRKQKKDKSVTICYPPFMVPYMDKHRPAVIETKTTMKKLPSIEEISEITAENKIQRKKREGSTSTRDYSKRQHTKFNLIKESEYSNTTGSGSTSPSKYWRKKHRSGMTDDIDECWCDILRENKEDERLHGSYAGNEVEATQNEDIRRQSSLEQSTSTKEATGRNSPMKTQSSDKTPSLEKSLKKSSLEISVKSGETDPAKTRLLSRDSGEQEMFVTLPPTGEEISPENSPHEETTADEMSGVSDKAVSPHAYACHSSLTGAYANRTVGGKPHIFGYDFHTSSSSDLSEEETDLKTSTSK